MKSTSPYLNNGLPNVQWIEIAPEDARVWLDDWNTENRNKRPAHVTRIARDMIAGKFLITGDTIKFDSTGRLIDGQHRLAAIIKSGRAAWILVVTELDPDVQTVVDAGAKRSGADALKFKGLGGHYSVIAAAARIGLSRESGRLVLATDRASVNPTNPEVIEWAVENLDVIEAAARAEHYRKIIPARPAVLTYAVMELSRIDAGLTIEFFDSIRDMRTTGRGDPRLALSKFLAASREGTGHPENQIGFGLFAIFYCWNAWREGKSLTVITPMTRSRDERGNRIPREIPTPR